METSVQAPVVREVWFAIAVHNCWEHRQEEPEEAVGLIEQRILYEIKD